MPAPFPLSPALWHATAPPAPEMPPLEADTTADVCVIGGGYAGLAAALALAERGRSVVLIETHEAGWGASGRNGGQVIPGLKHDPSELETRFGVDAGAALWRFAGLTADRVFDRIRRHGMQVPAARHGWIQGAHTPAMVETAKRRAAEWAERGAPTAFLDRDAATTALGTGQYLGGWIDRRGGAIQPLAYARGLAAAAIAAGAALHGRTRATAIGRNGARFAVRTAAGASVHAAKVLVATGAYAGDLIPGLAQTIIAPNSFLVATQPLGHNLARQVLPGGVVTSDTRQLLFYFRRDAEDRFLLGGRGTFREPRSEADWAHLERAVGLLYPALAGVPIQYRWCGRVALTRDFLPHLHEPELGLIIDIGCMGRGIGLQTALGEALAAYLATGDRANLPFPVTPIAPIPFHALRGLYVGALVAWYRLTDGGLKPPDG